MLGYVADEPNDCTVRPTGNSMTRCSSARLSRASGQ